MSVVEWAARAINTLTLITIVVGVGAWLLAIGADVVGRWAVAACDRWDNRRREHAAFSHPHRSGWQP